MSKSKSELKLISKISKRAILELNFYNNQYVDLMMDIECAHIDCPMNLHTFINFDQENFAHDIYGIRKHLDRNTKELTDCFVPRCAIPS